MSTVTIPQKMSGTGSIHDLESPNFDREVIFEGDNQYAFVTAAHYGADDHEFFASLDAAMDHLIDSDYSGEVIGRDGTRHTQAGVVGQY